jgi:hypothetical protein
MRLVIVLAALLAGGLAGFVIVQNVLRPPPAADRLAGVSVSVAGYAIEDLPSDGHRLHLSLAVTSLRDVDECLGFALDEPFAGRRMSAGMVGCVRPRRGTATVPIVYDGLSDDDLAFPSHTIVWGIPGGRCGLILEAFGVCVVEQAGTAALELPTHSVLPSFGLFGSLGPIFAEPSFAFP